MNTVSPGRAVPASSDMSRCALAPLTDAGSMGDVIRALGHLLVDGAAADLIPVTPWRLRENTTLFHEGAAVQQLYVLSSGSLKCVKTLADGYEQVLFFAHPGELLGFEALHSGIHPASVVALEDAVLFGLPVHDLPTLQDTLPSLRESLHLALSRQLSRLSDTAEMMAAVASDARLACFLLGWSARMAQTGQSPHRLHFCMGRRDIASLLGLAHETVSRSFTLLADAGLLSVNNRDIEILDVAGLKLRAAHTRGMCLGRGAKKHAVLNHGPVGNNSKPSPLKQQPEPWHGSLLALQE